MEPAPELIELAARIGAAMSDHNIPTDFFAGAMSTHEGFLSIGNAQRDWQTREEAVATVRALKEAYPPGRFEGDKAIAWKEGTIGWVATAGWMEFEGAEPQYLRATMMFRQEGVYWRVIHSHFSVAVSDTEVYGHEFDLEDFLVAALDDPAALRAIGRPGEPVTLMFTDIESSTALLETLGDEAWRERCREHDDAISQQASLYGGHVVKGLGDGFLLAFPAVGSALACAIAIQRLVEAPRNDESAIHVRVGLHVGEVITEAGDVFGRTVVLAARLAASASGGEILVSEAVHRALAGAVEFGSERSLTLKGLAGEHAAYPALWSPS